MASSSMISPTKGFSLALGLSSTLAITCNSTTIIFQILLIVAFAIKHDEITPIVGVAIGLEALSLGVFLWLSVREMLRRSRIDRHRERGSFVMHGHFLFCVLLSTLAGAMTIAASVWMVIIANNLTQEFRQSPWGGVTALIVTTVLTTIFQIVFLVLLSKRQPTSHILEDDRSMPEIVQAERPDTSKSTIVSNPFTNRDGISSPPISPSSTSLRSSFSIPSRTGSSKTRLTLSRPSSKSADLNQQDFTWDTSSVPPLLRDTVYSHTRAATVLPPIPGSRPASPAKTLDGPFLPPSPHPPQSQPTSPMSATFSQNRPSSPTNIHPSSPTLDSVPLSPPHAPFMISTPNRSRSRTGSLASRTSSPDITQLQSRLRRADSATSLADSVSHLRTQPSFDEENIHPLFRASSPTPPPGASLNTIVTAATVPEAEEVAITTPTIGSRRGRAESRVGSPLAQSPEATPSLESPAEFWTPAVETGREGTGWPLSSSPVAERENLDDSATPVRDGGHVGHDERREERRPEEGEILAGPIPSFILAAGSRGSFLNFEERRRKSEFVDENNERKSEDE